MEQEFSDNRESLQLMVQVARMYYESAQTQEEIARRFKLTRQKVSRLLIEAKSRGIIKIAIFDPNPGDPQLRNELKNSFHLKEVILAHSGGLEGDPLRNSIAMAAAEYIKQVMRDGIVVGVGWGRTLFETIKSLGRNGEKRVQAVPLIGGIGDQSQFFQVNELARRLSDTFNGSYRNFYAPAFLQDNSILESLVKTQEIAQVMDLWNKLDLALVGIGQVEFQQISSMFFADHIPAENLAQLEAKGTVGDICARFFDSNGNQILPETGVIGIRLDQLRAVPDVIGIAGGIEKVRAVLGALRGGYVKTLITDVATAHAVLAENEKRR